MRGIFKLRDGTIVLDEQYSSTRMYAVGQTLTIAYVEYVVIDCTVVDAAMVTTIQGEQAAKVIASADAILEKYAAIFGE